MRFGPTLRNGLLDPSYWRPRLERLERAARHLVVLPRPDWGRPGSEVLELHLRSHDGNPLVALLARNAFAWDGVAIRVRLAPALGPEAIDWDGVEAGQTDVIFTLNGSRRLPDCVLDVIRVARAACDVQSADGGQLSFPPTAPRGLEHRAGPSDALVLADLLRRRGWI